ncbi:MAG: hypothetical protein EBU90_07150 [Proteobacteria bacterium]|nr:hypothetical protein [Pseudomonadota bacterium]
MKIGIIQSRGLGDIVIALPIAYHYHQEGHNIHWPIVDTWVEQMQTVAPYVTWHPVKPDHGPFFYDTPQAILRDLGVDEVLCLYNSLTGHPEFADTAYFQHVTFDRFKYLRAGVPFQKKWQLAQCINRDPVREQAHHKRLGITGPYVVTHLNSSEQTVRMPPDLIPPEYQVVPISSQGWIWDWLYTIENAEALVMTDSVVANMVDQLDIAVEKYFIPQHHIQLTPVHLSDWIWLPNPDLKTHARIFRAA